MYNNLFSQKSIVDICGNTFLVKVNIKNANSQKEYCSMYINYTSIKNKLKKAYSGALTHTCVCVCVYTLLVL